MQDIPSPNAAKPNKAHAAERRERLRVLLLGTNLWVLCALWPALSARGERSIEVAFETLGLLPLALGAALSGNSGRSARAHIVRPALLLVVFPTALAAAIALRAEPLNQQLFGPFALCVLAISLCAYGAAVATSIGTPKATELRAKHVALSADPWDAAPVERTLARRSFIGACFAGAAALSLIAPRLGGYAALERAWGDSAAVGGVLTAVVGTALGVTLLALYLGEGLRAAMPREAETETGLRTTWFLFLALLGAVTFFVIQP